MYLYPQSAARGSRLGALQTSARRRRRYGLRGLGDSSALLSPQAYCASQCNNKLFLQALTTSMQNRLLVWPPLPGQASCSGMPSSSTAQKVTAIGAGAVSAAVPITGALVSTGVIAGGALTAAIPVVGAIVAPIMLVLGTIFANHQRAVQLQSNVLCENVPAANAALQQIDAGIAAGTITPAQALSGYQQMLSSFQAAMKSDPSYKTGDALWGYNQILQGVIAQRTADLQGSAGASSILGTSGLPSWLPWAAGAAALYFLL